MIDKSWIGVDLDGTLALYNGWKGPKDIGRPIIPMLNMVKRLIKRGKTIKIFTARAAFPEYIPPIKKWLAEVGLPDLEVTNVKDFNMVLLYDDRARQVEFNRGVLITENNKQKKLDF